jgi:translation initiation factor eIF-2B subunit gamma
LHINLQDAHLYIFKHWVLDVINEKEKISSIRQDLVPLIVKCQYQRKLLDIENMGKCRMITLNCSDHSLHALIILPLDASKEDPLDTALSLSTVHDVFDEKLLNEHDPYNSNFKSNIKVNTFIYRGGHCGRANTIAKYSEMNRLVCRL